MSSNSPASNRLCMKLLAPMPSQQWCAGACLTTDLIRLRVSLCTIKAVLRKQVCHVNLPLTKT